MTTLNQVLTKAGVVIKAASSAIAKTGAAATTYVYDGVFKAISAATDCVLTGAACNTKIPTGFSQLIVLAVNGSADARDVLTGAVVASGGVAAGATAAFQAPYMFKAETISPAGVPETRQRGYTYSKDSTGATVTKATNFYGESMAQTLKDLPPGFVPYAVVKVANASGADFVPGTTALDAANTGVTYTDISTLPENANF